ncbi:hypothetical protein KEM52_002833 [Ascosphaera acerosa]|nr:hypothetical protein KEM52_002833 [Ascosphaera acerosa]
MVSVPAPVKRLFDSFPLKTYPATPGSAADGDGAGSDCHRLYVFTDARGAEVGAPSFNPECLKWQVSVSVRTVASNNHASPSGALPFLLPAGDSKPVTAKKMVSWLATQGLTQDATGEHPQVGGSKLDVYIVLVEEKIRRAWVNACYFEPANFSNYARRLYVDTATTCTPVRLALAHQLQAAARSEILRSASTISTAEIEAEAAQAFAALSALLGDNEYFSQVDEDAHRDGEAKPGLFDASVFAYTYWLLDPSLLARNRLGEMLKEHDNLVRHRQRLAQAYFA